MQKKLTIPQDEKVYFVLHAVVRPHVVQTDLVAYQEMAADVEREAEAMEWAEATLKDVARRGEC